MLLLGCLRRCRRNTGNCCAADCFHRQAMVDAAKRKTPLFPLPQLLLLLLPSRLFCKLPLSRSRNAGRQQLSGTKRDGNATTA